MNRALIIVIALAVLLIGSSSCREVGKDPIVDPNPIEITSVTLQGTLTDRPGSTVTYEVQPSGTPQTGPSAFTFTETIDVTLVPSVDMEGTDEAVPVNTKTATLFIE